MDNNRFDQLTRALGSGANRRQVLRALAGSVVGAAVGPVVRSASAAQSNDDCASFCTQLPPGPARGQCVSDAAQGQGLCYQCGPASGDPTALLCAGNCVDSSADNQNCGGCGQPCDAGKVCVDSSCISPCPAPQVDCGSGCTDLLTDPSNCGSCGEVCSFVNAIATCANAACALGACTAGWGNCDLDDANGCETDLQQSTQHCGWCGNVCSAPSNATAICELGNCGFVCNGGFTRCGDICVDVLSDPNHCGSCDAPLCPEGASCANGDCHCPASAPVACANRCVDLQSDVEYCGGCDAEPCPIGATCANGACQCPSSLPDVCLDWPDYRCVDTQNDYQNCGERCAQCGQWNGVQQYCRGGQCRGAVGQECYDLDNQPGEDFCYSGQCINVANGQDCTDPTGRLETCVCA